MELGPNTFSGWRRLFDTLLSIESPSTLQDLKERPAFVCKLGYEAVKNSSHPSEVLHFLWIPRWFQFLQSDNLVRIYFNTSICDQKSKKLSQAYSEDTFGGVQLQRCSLRTSKVFVSFERRSPTTLLFTTMSSI